MPLRRRLTLVSAAAVGVAIAIAVVVSYLAVRHELRGRVDAGLRGDAASLQHIEAQPLAAGEPGPPPDLVRPAPFGGEVRRFPRLGVSPRGGPSPYVQVLRSNGTVERLLGAGPMLPVTSAGRRVVAGNDGEHIEDVTFRGIHLRVLTAKIPGGAVELARPLSDVDKVLSRLRAVLVLVTLGGIALAVLLGLFVSRRLMSPIARVSEAARDIGQTAELDQRIEVETNDEVGELARRFNAMLDTLAASQVALATSVGAQRQLVADASHELRTPVTSLRTNIEILLDSPTLPEAERERLLVDALDQSEELGALVTDLIELARGDEHRDALEDVRLDKLVDESVQRAQRHTADVAFNASLEPIVVEGVPERLGRAVNNLLDNAAKHSKAGEQVDVTVSAEGLTVRDYGDGIADDDLDHIFDRFYRGASARGKPGTGLGLAIVRQVAEAHGGSVQAENAPGGGAAFHLRLPTAPVGEPVTSVTA